MGKGGQRRPEPARGGLRPSRAGRGERVPRGQPSWQSQTHCSWQPGPPPLPSYPHPNCAEAGKYLKMREIGVQTVRVPWWWVAVGGTVVTAISWRVWTPPAFFALPPVPAHWGLHLSPGGHPDRPEPFMGPQHQFGEAGAGREQLPRDPREGAPPRGRVPASPARAPTLVLSPRGSPSQKLLLLPAPLPCRAEAPLLFLRQTESGCGSPEAGKAGRVGWRGLGGSGKARFPDEEASANGCSRPICPPPTLFLPDPSPPLPTRRIGPCTWSPSAFRSRLLVLNSWLCAEPGAWKTV